MKSVPDIPTSSQCELLGPVSIIIQSFMGVVAISSLVLKRFYEHPKRPWKIWIFDVSKQVLGAAGVHILNLLLSMLKSKSFLYYIFDGIKDDNECIWYFLSLFMDTTIGVPILWLCLLFIYHICEYLKLEGIESGNYGDPPSYHSYVKQLLIFVVSLALMKVIIYLLLYFPIFIIYAEWVLSWSDRFPNLQIFLVMMVFPIMLNCFQYYIIDNIIKFPNNYKTLSSD